MIRALFVIAGAFMRIQSTLTTRIIFEYEGIVTKIKYVSLFRIHLWLWFLWLGEQEISGITWSFVSKYPEMMLLLAASSRLKDFSLRLL